MTGVRPAEAVLVAVTDAGAAGVPADVTLLLGGLAAGGAELELDQSEARDVVPVLTGGGDPDGFVGEAEMHPAVDVAVGENQVVGELGLDEGHLVQSVHDAAEHAALAELGECVSQVEDREDVGFAGGQGVVCGFVFEFLLVQEDFSKVVDFL